VRVVKIGSSSTELCGGTHVENTGAIGLFRILSESSVAAGVRRITAVTGENVLRLLDAREGLLTNACEKLKAPSFSDLTHRADQLNAELKEARRKLEAADAELSRARLSSLFERVEAVGSLRLLTARLEMTPDAARTLCDTVKDTCPDMVAVFAVTSGDKLTFMAVCGKDAVKAGAHAGKIASAVAAVTGGKGGGRPDSAMAGGRDLAKVKEALALVKTLL